MVEAALRGEDGDVSVEAGVGPPGHVGGPRYPRERFRTSANVREAQTDKPAFYFLFQLVLGDAHLRQAARSLAERVRRRSGAGWGGTRRLGGRDEGASSSPLSEHHLGWLRAQDARTHTHVHTQMSARRVGFCLSDKKRRRMNLDAFADLCA